MMRVAVRSFAVLLPVGQTFSIAISKRTHISTISTKNSISILFILTSQIGCSEKAVHKNGMYLKQSFVREAPVYCRFSSAGLSAPARASLLMGVSHGLSNVKSPCGI